MFILKENTGRFCYLRLIYFIFLKIDFKAIDYKNK